MEAAYAVSATSEATGHSKEMALDWNPDTYWAASGVGTVNIIIDLVTAKAIDRVAIWIHNYTTNLNPHLNQYFNVYHSPDGSTWTQWAGSVLLPGDGATQFLLNDVAAAQVTKRYWKIELVCPEFVCELRAVYICSVYSVAQGNQVPESSPQKYLVDESRSLSGQVFTNLLSKHKFQTFNRAYLFATGTAWEGLPIVQAWNACRGNWRPFLLLDDATTYMVCRFNGEITPNAQSYLVFNPTVALRTEPYVEPGETL
jgi:hypothetical protein